MSTDIDTKSEELSDYEMPGTLSSSLSLSRDIQMSPVDGVNPAATWDDDDDLYNKEHNDHIYEELDYTTLDRR